MTTPNASVGSQPNPRERLTRRALIVWGAAVLFYIVAIFGRTSFGVAGVAAIDRFGVDASRIAVFTAVQIGVYALAQIPTGLLIDKFGPRRVLVIGALVMGSGQVLLGLTGNYWVAIAARVLIGAGDASAFLSAMRILPFWFPLRLTPLFTQLTSSLGQLGQFLSAVPFLMLLNVQGWTVAFVSVGAAAVLVAIFGGIAIADPPEQSPAGPGSAEQASARGGQEPTFWAKLSYVLRHPACWEAFFIHYSAMLWQIVFTLLWGAPLMKLGMGLSDAQVGLVLTINTATNVIAGPIIGVISQRAGRNRDRVVVLAATAIATAWFFFLLPGTPPGLGALIAVNIVMAFLTGTSSYGFDGVRETLSRNIVATGTGLGNMGGFLAGMVAAQTVGLLLDYSSHGQTYTWGDFRFAWISVFVIWGLGMVGIAVSKMLLKRRLADAAATGSVRVVDEDQPEK